MSDKDNKTDTPEHELVGAEEKQITDYTPTEVYENTASTVSCRAEPLDPVMSGTLHSLGAVFTNQHTGKVYQADLTITDPTTYSLFLIQVPPLEWGEFDIEFNLASYSKASKLYKYKSTKPFTVIQVGGATPTISRIAPSKVQKSELRDTKYTIFGENLRGIASEVGFFLDNQRQYKFRTVGAIQSDRAQVMYRGSDEIQEGSHRVSAVDSSTMQAVESIARFRIADDE